VDLEEVQNGGWELIFPRNLAHPSPRILCSEHAPGAGPRNSKAGTNLMSCSPAKPGARRPRGSACAGGSPSRCGTSCDPRPDPRNPS
jgi:hypothetical protein